MREEKLLIENDWNFIESSDFFYLSRVVPTILTRVEL